MSIVSYMSHGVRIPGNESKGSMREGWSDKPEAEISQRSL